MHQHVGGGEGDAAHHLGEAFVSPNPAPFTMALCGVMVPGPVCVFQYQSAVFHEIAASLFAPGYTMASLIANEFSEATDDLHLSALMALGTVLFARRQSPPNASCNCR